MKKLTGEEIFPYIHGVLKCSVNPAGQVEFHRFTQKQLLCYRNAGRRENLNYEERALASSGVVLEMNTDSSFIGMEFKLLPAARPMASFDLYVDGVLADHWFSEELSVNVLSFELPEGMHRIQIFFPWSVIVKLRSVVLDDGAAAEPVIKKHRALACGDSITQGYISLFPSLSYVNCAVRELDLDCVNQAVGGYYFDAGSLDAELAAFAPEIITVAYGTNDYSLLVTPETTEKSCRDFTVKLTSIFPETKILGLMPIFRIDVKNRSRDRIRDYRISDWHAAIRSIYKACPNITVLEDTYYPRPEAFYAPDGVHPNDLGFVLYGQAVTKAIRELL